jgi:hypothetical protein
VLVVRQGSNAIAAASLTFAILAILGLGIPVFGWLVAPPMLLFAFVAACAGLGVARRRGGVGTGPSVAAIIISGIAVVPAAILIATALGLGVGAWAGDRIDADAHAEPSTSTPEAIDGGPGQGRTVASAPPTSATGSNADDYRAGLSDIASDLRSDAQRFVGAGFGQIGEALGPFAVSIASARSALVGLGPAPNPDALAAGTAVVSTLDDDALRQRGLRLLTWLLGVQTADNGRLSVIGSDGWLRRGGRRAQYDQQPLEAAALIEACKAAHRATDDQMWLDEMRRCFTWYLGENDAGVSLIEFKTHGCYDGLQRGGVNQNFGAESCVSWLLSLLTMHEMQPGEAPDRA